MVLVSEGTVSNLEIQPTLMEQIKKAQQGHPSIEGIKRKMSLGKASEFITARELTPTWEEFEAAKAEWAVEQEASKAAQRERKSQKTLKKREARRRKK